MSRIVDLKNDSTQIVLLPAKHYCGDASSDTYIGSTGTYTPTATNTYGEVRKLLVITSIGATATATCQIIIQESSDNSSFTTLQELTVSDTSNIADLTPTKQYIRAYIALSATGDLATWTYVDAGVIGIAYNERYIPNNAA